MRQRTAARAAAATAPTQRRSFRPSHHISRKNLRPLETALPPLNDSLYLPPPRPFTVGGATRRPMLRHAPAPGVGNRRSTSSEAQPGKIPSG